MNWLRNRSPLLPGVDGIYSTLETNTIVISIWDRYFPRSTSGRDAEMRKLEEKTKPLLFFLPIPSLSITSSAHRIAGPLLRSLLLSAGSCAPRNRNVAVAIGRVGSVESLVWVCVRDWATELRVGEVVLEREERNNGGFRPVRCCVRGRASGREGGGIIACRVLILKLVKYVITHVGKAGLERLKMAGQSTYPERRSRMMTLFGGI